MIPDQMLAEALAAENARRLNAYLTELQERPAFPLSGRAEKRLLRALSDLQRSAAGGRVRRPERKKLVRALLIAALLIALLFVAAMAYAPFHNAILRPHGEGLEIIFQRDEAQAGPYGHITFIPEGYELVSEERSRFSEERVYQNGNMRVAVQSAGNGTTFILDADDNNAQKVSINGAQGYLSETDSTIVAVWSKDNISFMITADRTPAITPEIVVQIAQSWTPESG